MSDGRRDQSTEIVRAENLRRVVDGKTLLNDVSLTIASGDRIAVVGSTGSGKTLLLRALAMLDAVDEGQLYYHGHDVAAQDIPLYRSKVMYLHQRPAFGEESVLAELQRPFTLKAHRDRSFDREFVENQLQSLHRDASFLAQSCRDLSGGESQIVALLRAIELHPQVLLLDEPTAALDADSTQQVEQLVECWLEESSQSRAMVWVTHDGRQAERMGNRRIVIRDGGLT